MGICAIGLRIGGGMLFETSIVEDCEVCCLNKGHRQIVFNDQLTILCKDCFSEVLQCENCHKWVSIREIVEYSKPHYGGHYNICLSCNEVTAC